MNRRRSSLGVLKWDALPDPGPRFQLGERLGTGVNADVFEAQDLQNSGRSVAIKIQPINEETMEDLEEEYNVLQRLSEHQNLPDFYGAYRKRSRDADQLWLVMELCKGGSIADLLHALDKAGRKLSELHIAFILKEVIKAVRHLHQHHVMHRDIRASNILLTGSGEVRLVDFGLSRELKSTMGKRGTCTGSPNWMAPEVVTAEKNSKGQEVYDNRCDVWALGITAIELADCKAPYEGIHPTRALFQIVRNPPPTLRRPANWSQILNDFIAECLEKNPENRPYLIELVEHPFFEKLPENDFHIPQELKAIMESVKSTSSTQCHQETLVRANFLKSDQNTEPEVMLLEDLAANDVVNEDIVLDLLQQRVKRGAPYTFIGDVLLFLNPNESQDIYNDETQRQYVCKSRSDSKPHIYTMADCALQDALHHEEPQHIILSGESVSGKTTNMMHCLRHLLFLGKGFLAVTNRILNSMMLIHAMGNACTPLNGNSTRHVLHTYVTFTVTGKASGAIFWLYQLERWRVTTDDRRQGNFHLFYYFYDAMAARKLLKQYRLENGRRLRYLRSVVAPSGGAPSNTVSSDPGAAASNVRHFEAFELGLRALEFSDENIETVRKMLAAILVLGELRFRDGGDGKAEIENPPVASSVASLLDVDEKKLSWALANYCVVEQGQAEKRRQSPAEAEEARDAVARVLYSRLVDWIINNINLKLSFTRAVYGDRHMVSILDLFGLECFQRNSLEQLLVNSLNEQLQYHYTQRLFAWEMQEREEEGVTDAERLTFYNNRPTIDLLMAKPDGVMSLVDTATRTQRDAEFIVGTLKELQSMFCTTSSKPSEFSVAHYTGKVTYDVRDFVEKNRDFVPPEVTETLRLSSNAMIKEMFTNLLSRTGNLTQAPLDVTTAEAAVPATTDGGRPRRHSKWAAAIMSDKQKEVSRKFNTKSRGQFSQTRRMRTAGTTFRAVCLEILRAINNGGTHFVRCLRAELTGQPKGFQLEVVRQQLRALGVVDTVRARQGGFPCRVTFSEFLRRYKFLAFDFDEAVEETGDNCRLLMVRLKMEGYAMGKTKMFLKYYNEEYLARLYEVQVKKIVKVQAMLRSYLAKKRIDHAGTKKPGSLAGLGGSKDEVLKCVPHEFSTTKDFSPEKKTEKYCGPKVPAKKASEMDQEQAALTIQKHYRGFQARKEYGPKVKASSTATVYDKDTALLLRLFYRRWRARSIFQVLMLYRAARHQDIVYLSQQVHVYNQVLVTNLQAAQRKSMVLDKIRSVNRQEAGQMLGNKPANVWKLPFRFDKLPYFDTSLMCDPVAAGLDSLYSDNAPRPGEYDAWDAPFRRKQSLIVLCDTRRFKDQEVQTAPMASSQSSAMKSPQSSAMKSPQSCAIKSPQSSAIKSPQSCAIKSPQSCAVESPQSSAIKSPQSSAMKSPQSCAVESPKSSAVGVEANHTHTSFRHERVENISPIKKINRKKAPTPVEFLDSPKKHFAPPIPEQLILSTNASRRSSSSSQKGRAPKPPAVIRRSDLDNNNELDFPRENNTRVLNGAKDRGPQPNSHVRELEMLGKAITSGDGEDAPFNFQAMLRKTNYNRSSVKRMSTYSLDFEDEDKQNNSHANFNISTYADNNKHIHYKDDQSGESTTKIATPTKGNGGAIRKMCGSSSGTVKGDEYQENNEAEIEMTGASSLLNNNETRFELAPGIILEGEVADL